METKQIQQIEIMKMVRKAAEFEDETRYALEAL
jgi:hypothetical protein